MFAGHIGVALAAARVEPRVNVGVLAVASLLLDLLLWLFVLVGFESVLIPSNFSQTHQAEFVFPYSHGLLAAAVWSALAGAVLFSLRKSSGGAEVRAAFVIAGVVFSHWVLDAAVHRPELPLMGNASSEVGIGLWSNMPVALGIEGALVVAGALLFLPRSALPRAKKLALVVLVLLLLGFTVAGMTVAPPPPSATAMAASSLGAIVLACALIGWLGNGAPSRLAAA